MPPRLTAGPHWREFLFVILLLAGEAVLLQFAAGAYSAEFASEADEGSHYVTGAMIADYLTTAAGSNPVEFAERYYVRHPKVAFGIWPPVFHLVEGGWMALFSKSRASILILMALISAVLGLHLYCVARRYFGRGAALIGALLLLALPAVQMSSSAVMPDTLSALLMFASAMAFGRYLEAGTIRPALSFGAFASLAILTKYNALALALVPLLAVLISARWALLRRMAFWLPALLVAVVCTPWYLSSRTLVVYAAQPVPESSEVFPHIIANGKLIWTMTGPVAMFALLGFIGRFRDRRAPSSGLWVSCASFLVAVWFFHSVLYPVSATRYLIATCPVMILFAAAGVREVMEAVRLPNRIPRPAFTAALAIAVLYASVSFAVPSKAPGGMTPAALGVMREIEHFNDAILVISDAKGEGGFISELLMQGTRKAPWAIRGSKFLAQGGWMEQGYRLRHSSTDQVMTAIRKSPIRWLVVDEMGVAAGVPHGKQMLEVLRRHPEEWELTGRYSRGPVRRIALYRLRTTVRETGQFAVDLSYTRGKVLTSEF